MRIPLLGRSASRFCMGRRIGNGHKPSRIILGATLIFFLIPSAAPASAADGTEPVEQAIKQLTDGIGTILGSIFNPAETEFRAAVKERRFDDALKNYEKNSVALRQNKDLGSTIQELLAYARTRYGVEVENWLSRVVTIRAGKGYQSDLKGYIATVNAGPELAKVYLNQAQVLRDFRDSDPLLAKLQIEEAKARDDLRVNLAEVYRNFPHEQMSFKELVSEVGSESDLFQANWDAVNQRFETVSETDAKALVKNTASAWSVNPDLRAKVSVAVWKRVAPANAGPVASLQSLSKLTEFGLTKSDVPGRPRVFVADATAGAADMPIRFASAHDGSLKSASDVLGTSSGDGASPTVVIQIQESTTKRNIVDKKEVSSEFKSGTRSVPNPNYSIAEMNCRSAQSDLAAQRVRNTIAPARGWGALIQGFGEGLIAGNTERICNEFASTPPSREVDVLTPYSYTVTNISLTRSIRGRVVAFNGPAGDVEIFPLAIEEKETLKVAYGFKEGDRGPSDGTISDADLEKRALREFELDADRIVLALEPVHRVNYPRAELIAVLSERPKQASPLPASMPTLASAEPAMHTAGRQIAYAPGRSGAETNSLDSRMQSIVVVLNPKGTIGAGFYVGTNDILTNYHVIEGASTVELRGLDGQLFTGRIIKKDIGVDLALIRVDRVGTPVQFSQSILRAGDTVDAVGHPKGLFFSVSRGIVSAVRQMKNLLAQGGDRALVIQTDAQINPGNSGGPLFLGGQVVGVNTIKFRGTDGIGFAVHYSEALKFLSQQ